MSITASAITPTDLREHTNLPNRHTWTREAMQCVVDALDGAPVVAITLDTMTGHTLLGARLTGVRQTPGYGTHEVRVVSADSDRAVWHPLAKMGAIITQEGPARGARWVALDLYRERGHSAADSRESRIQRYGYRAVQEQERATRERLAQMNAGQQ